MGTGVCKCNVGEGEEEQVRLSREKNAYSFADSPQTCAESALAVPEAHSGLVPPLPPLVQATKASSSKLASVAEETGADLEKELETPTGPNGRRILPAEQLAELKEVLFQTMDKSGQLPAKPGDAAGRNALEAARTCADAASGQPLAVEDRSLCTPGSKEVKLYGGPTADKEKDSHRRDANVVGDKGDVICDMTLPAAADIALADSKDARSHQNGAPEPRFTEQANLGMPDTDKEAEPDSKGFGCFQLTESSNCDCPLGGNPTLELRRDERPKEETYARHDMDAPAPCGLSALAIPPETSQANGEPSLRPLQPDSHMDSIPVFSDGEPLGAPPPPPPGDLDDLRKAAEAKPATNGGACHPSAEGAPAGVDAGHPEEDALIGEWLNDGMVNVVTATTVHFATGQSVAMERTSDTTCHMVLDGAVYFGRLSPDRQKFLWSDGDVWTRKAKGPDPSAKILPGNATNGAKAKASEDNALSSMSVNRGSHPPADFEDKDQAKPPESPSPKNGMEPVAEKPAATTASPPKGAKDAPRRRARFGCCGGGSRVKR